MNTKTPAAAALTWSRRGLRTVRSLSPIGLIAVTLALVFGGVGIAGAATSGNPFILGQSNSETSESYLNNSNGVPLKLVAPATSAPLRVSNSNLVSGLNAQYVSGYNPLALAYGGAGYLAPPTPPVALDGANQQVASTGQLDAGTYLVTATAQMTISSADGAGYCFIRTGSNPAEIQQGGSQQTGNAQAAETTAVSVSQGDTLQEWCRAGGSQSPTGSTVYYAAITAIRVLDNNGTSQASTAVRTHRSAPARHSR
jgi:hypothetical protein